MGKSPCPDTGRFAFRIQEFVAQRRQHTDSAVIGSTSSDADDKIPAAFLNGVFDHLAHAVGGRIQRTFILSHKDNAGCRRHLHDRGACLPDHAVGCLYPGLQGAVYIHRHHLAAKPLCQGFRCPFSAVCQRLHDYFRIRKYIQDSLFNCSSRLHGSHASL